MLRWANLPSAWQQTAREGLNAVFPHQCSFCGCVCPTIPGFRGVCRHCLPRLPLRSRGQVRLSWAQLGADQTSSEGAVYCAAWYEEPLRKALVRLKFSDSPELAETLAAILLQCCRQNGLDCHAVAAVPLHPSRLRERGYNQAGLLAANLARQLERPDWSGGIVRVRATGRQSDLKDRLVRRANLTDAFAPDPSFQWAMADKTPAQQRSILLVDDILTTGATLAEAARVFWQKGFLVNGLVVASDQQPSLP